MKIISIGTDRKMFEHDSPVLARAKGYAMHVEEMHIIVLSLQEHELSPMTLGNLYIYPTSSRTRFLYIWDAYRLGRRIIRERRLGKNQSVVSTQDPFETGLAGWLLKRRFGLPLQIQIHTDPWSPYFANSFLNKIRLLIARFTIPRADAFRVVSRRIGESLKQHFPRLTLKLSVLPIFVDINALSHIPPGEDLRKRFPQFDHLILMASRLTIEKDIPTALKAFRTIAHDFPRSGLVIAGNGPEILTLRSLSQELGLSKQVVFLGWQNNLAALYGSATIFLFTSLYEGYGMTLIEAAAAGVPVVTTDVGIAREIFTDGEEAFICQVGDAACVASGLRTLLGNDEKRELFKAKIQDTIRGKSMSWEEYTSRYVELLKALLRP